MTNYGFNKIGKNFISIHMHFIHRQIRAVPFKIVENRISRLKTEESMLRDKEGLIKFN